ncbi:MAG TPA: hypothetical protein DCL48_10480, partial [Alphaproteobacteria bacterium]|nr:hypothetical protein [Alphaproteobacteria bacterium]
SLAASLITACGEDPKKPAKEPGVNALPATQTEQERLIADGKIIAEQQCASCHAIGTTGDSPNPKSPPLRVALGNYAPGALAEDLREGLRVGHPDMPRIQISPQGVDALMAYLLSIQERRAEAK